MKLNNFRRNIIDYIRKKIGKVRPPNRKIFVNYNGSEPEALLDPSFKKKRKNNFIKTSKYTIWNFLPKNIFEQFRRIAYFYFLINVIVIFAIPDPPSSPYTSVIPLAIVVFVTAIKQAYEDFLRHREDRKINESLTRVLKNGAFKETKWKDVRVGDILEVSTGSMFPCDLVLLYSDTEDDVCYITTANLDGETNLKEKSRPKSLEELDSEEKLLNLKAIITCDHPNTNLYQFKGKMLLGDTEFPLTNDNILLRGSCLKISPKIYGCAIYTGFDTKVMLNSKLKSNKLSCIEKKLNAFIIVFLAILAVLTFLCYGLSFLFTDFYDTHWYLKGTEPKYFKENRNLYNFIFLIYFMNLLNYIVPLSLYVTVEMQRFFGSKFIEWDIKLYDEETDKPAKANTSDLNEDLGQVEYLFSDKTGTLTKNEMIFKQFSINNQVFEERSGKLYQVSKKKPEDITDAKFSRFFELISLCHTVQIDLIDKSKYQASSPDEMCFVDFLHNLGIIFVGDRKMATNSINKSRVINFKSTFKYYEIMQILEFDSTRKRMSIIVKNNQTEKYILYCKGADSSILSKCKTGDIRTCEAHIKNFGSMGWRTLALAYRELSQEEYENCEKKLLSAFNDIENRNEKISLLYDEIESDLNLVGSTAIEDKLQEDVAETLKSLRQSGIKIWVLTGDKTETAINISTSCQHFPASAEKFFLTSMNEINEIKKHLKLYMEKIQNSAIKNFALVVDGQTLGFIFHHELDDNFVEICSGCDAVLGCRLSPAQKAQIVKLIKKSKSKPITAAIGDGANDVSMIQEAHIGFGLFGKEGNNAAKSSDFCFAKFKFLKRILLFHGYLYYTRSAVMVQYFFYKNVAFVICQVYFAIWNAFSGTTLFNSIVLTFYNITLTAGPILFFGIFEQAKSEKKIIKNPNIYKTIKKNKSLSAFEFIKWNLLGLWHSIIAYFFSFLFIKDDISFHSDGKMSGVMQFGALIIILIDLIVHAKLLTEWHFITWFTLFGYFLSILGFVVTCLVPNSFIMPSFLTVITDDQNLFWIFYDLFSSGSIWFLMIIIVTTAILPDIIIKIIENLRVSIFLYKENENKIRKKKSMISKCRIGDYSNEAYTFDSNKIENNKDKIVIPKQIDTENVNPYIEHNGNEKYYKTVMTEIDDEILFNTLV